MTDTTPAAGPDETRRNGGPEIPERPEVRVVREALVYEPGQAASYFQDLALAARRHDLGEQVNEHDPGTPEGRLARHDDQMAVELPAREQRARAAAQARGFELRVNPNRTPGQGGYFSPPLWLIDRFAAGARPGRVLADMIPSFPLPAGVQSVNLPRITNRGQAAVAADLATDTSIDDVDAAASSPVVTISGEGDVALQLLEQSPPGAHLDWAVFKDLTDSYDSQLETLLITGTGAGGQFYGLLNLPIPAANAITYTDASPTGPRLYPSVGQAAAAVGNNRLMPPELWLMRTARWAWLGTAEDTNGMPLAVPQHTPPGPIPYLFDDRRATPVSAMLGWPIYCDDAIPATLAAGQDAIIAARPSDMLLLESEPRTAVMLDVLSGTLQARLQLRAYAAALTGRYPSGVARITGTGMAVQTGFQ